MWRIYVAWNTDDTWDVRTKSSINIERQTHDQHKLEKKLEQQLSKWTDIYTADSQHRSHLTPRGEFSSSSMVSSLCSISDNRQHTVWPRVMIKATNRRLKGWTYYRCTTRSSKFCVVWILCMCSRLLSSRKHSIVTHYTWIVYSSLPHRVSLTFIFKLLFPSFDHKCTWWRLFQYRVINRTLDINIFINTQ